MIKTRALGETGLHLTELSFGAGAIGNLYRVVSPAEAYDVMDTSWRSGIRYFDTAPFYGHGLSERRVGDFLREREGWVLSSKVGKRLRPIAQENIPDFGFVDPLPFDVSFDYSYDGILRSYEDSLNRLGLNHIDILYVHDLEPSGFSPDVYEAHLKDFLVGGQRALADLKAQGAIKAYGLGVNEVSACLNVLSQTDLDCLLLAGRYTLLDRTAEAKLLPLCRAKGVSIIVGGVFNSGILATGAVEGAYFNYEPASTDIQNRVNAMQERLTERGVELANAALQFPLTSSAVASVLIGSGKSSSMERNIAMLNHRLDRDDFVDLERYAIASNLRLMDLVRLDQKSTSCT